MWYSSLGHETLFWIFKTCSARAVPIVSGNAKSQQVDTIIWRVPLTSGRCAVLPLSAARACEFMRDFSSQHFKEGCCWKHTHMLSCVSGVERHCCLRATPHKMIGRPLSAWTPCYAPPGMHCCNKFWRLHLVETVPQTARAAVLRSTCSTF